MNETERNAYILMERIFPPSKLSTLVRNGKANVADCLCELGIYGTFLKINGEDNIESIIINRAAGYLLRVKPSNVNEGGVAAGFAVLSTPLLF